MSKQKKTKQVN